jgi:hypothetical protein
MSEAQRGRSPTNQKVRAQRAAQRARDQSLRDIAAIANIISLVAIATLMLIYLIH